MVSYLQYLTNHLCEDLIHIAVTGMFLSMQSVLSILSMQSVLLLT